MLVVVGLLSGCYISPVVPPTGALYTNYSAPQSVGARGSLGQKTGKAQAKSILGMVSWGDASVSAAAREGGINKINHADYDFFNLLGIYQSYATVVYGD
jgi:hypothetical protein